MKDKSRPWRAFPCPDPTCGSLIFTDAEIGTEVVCPACRESVTVRRLGELVEEARESALGGRPLVAV